ncbi:MAG: VWA domain-containing protein [Acidobacteria bacterium]|nr:VWA domain-containing protein [Acidobacteriota bacterium]
MNPTFSTGVTYVSVPVVVTDTEGKAVAGLTDVDFRLYEDNTSQKIERLQPMTAGVNLALVVDASSSMRLEWSHLRTALLTFIETLRADDRVLLASFDDRVLVDAEFTSDRGVLRRAVSQMDRRQGTRLYDAVALVATRRVQAIPDREAIVLLTDGVDTRSRLADGESTRALIGESHMPVYVVQYDTRRNDYSLPSGNRAGGMGIRDMAPMALPEGAEDNTQLFLRADAYLAALRNLSGGRLFHAGTLRDLSGAFAQVAEDLGEQYTLGYYPANQARDGTYRSLRIEVNRPNVVVRARVGYRAASRPPGARH